jgi:hypothetical protein
MNRYLLLCIKKSILCHTTYDLQLTIFKVFRKLAIVFLLVFSSINLKAQCPTEIKAFKPGEKVTYQAYYNWGFLWIHAGDVQFTIDQKQYLGEQVYLFETIGNSVKKYDWVYKVRDKFQSYVNMESFNTLWAERNTAEGSYKAYENYIFSSPDKKIYSIVKNTKKPYKSDTLKSNSCTFDVLSAVYYCRTIDFEKYKQNEKIPVNIVLDGKTYSLYLRYLGKEVIKTRDDNKRSEAKKYRCIKFSALLVEGTIFKGGEDMFIWVTDDQNRIPVLVEAKILIGSVKAYVNTMEGIKHELTSLVK